ncbi:MAG: hypothetical protein ACFCUM_15510 [Bacteroidales bacterium]
MMEKIYFCKTNKTTLRIFLILGIILILISFIGLSHSIYEGFRTELLGGDWLFLFNLLQGIIFVSWAYSMQLKKKYFIGWDDNILQYHLPENNVHETMDIADIKDIELSLFEIKFKLDGQEKRLKLEEIEYKDMRKIKEKFENLKLSFNPQ